MSVLTLGSMEYGALYCDRRAQIFRNNVPPATALLRWHGIRPQTTYVLTQVYLSLQAGLQLCEKKTTNTTSSKSIRRFMGNQENTLKIYLDSKPKI